MIRICTACHSTWAGGASCEDCGAPLGDPFGPEAQALPPPVWDYIRLQYGARRGMLVRVLSVLLAPVAFGLTLRTAVGLPWPHSLFVGAAAAPISLLTWWTLHLASGRAVRIWVLRKGRVRRTRLARAFFRRLFRS